ncbi:MAG: formylglycine-generating enzyme family protein [Myxococcales bacterium]|nr:MAG: formylglycine-generating enzyme family protein [Myxococcales bacterium]
MGCSVGDTACDADEAISDVLIAMDFELTPTEITQRQYAYVMGANPSVFNNCPDCPVDSATWYEAAAFCEAIGGRLPTEAEWEYAARAGVQTRYYCGADASCLPSIAWYNEPLQGGSTHEVGQKQPNNWGLYDMLGNVKEWVATGYEETPDSVRVLRGGSWRSDANDLRLSHREGLNPLLTNGYTGFRCARDLMLSQ